MPNSEDIIGEKWDHCLTGTAIKTTAGLGLGIAASVLLFRRRGWPIIFGTGAGFGMGYNNCQHDFKSPVIMRAIQIKEMQKQKN